MQLYYCATCGNRLSNPDAEKVRPGEDAEKIVCPACALKAPPVAAAAPVTAPVPVPVGVLTGATPPKGATRPASVKQRGTEIRTRNSATSIPSSSGRASKTGKIPPQSSKSGTMPGTKTNTLIYAGMGIAAVALLAGFFMMNSSNPKAETRERVAQAEPPKAAKTIEKPVSSPLPEVPSEPAKKAEPPPKPAETFSPKEDYERRMREAAAKSTNAPNTDQPETPIPAAQTNAAGNSIKLPLPAYNPNDSDWHLLFNGKDLTGWQENKGHFIVENGEVVHVTQANASISTLVSYGDFDLNCKMFIQGKVRFSEISVRDLGYVFSINWPELGVWKDVRVSAHGKEVRATVDGTEVFPEDTPGTQLTGAVGFYSSQPAELKIKDIAIRPASK
jgi:hypothetical protein